MALERPISQQGDFLSHSHKLVRKHIIVPEKLVADEDKKVIPNHILDTSRWHTDTGSELYQVLYKVIDSIHTWFDAAFCLKFC